MGLLFENFMYNFLRREQHRFQVTKPPIRWRVEASSTDRRFLPGMEGDILLSDPTQRILIEAKFTPWPLKGTKLRSGHLYQLHTYLAHLGDGMTPLTGVLLYAEVDGPLRFDYMLAGHRLLVRSLYLAQPWQGIHENLLALAQEAAAGMSAAGSVLAAGLGERP
jgi:5-methylcytosine-specific restriction enzyme subunit McrC